MHFGLVCIPARVCTATNRLCFICMNRVHSDMHVVHEMCHLIPDTEKNTSLSDRYFDTQSIHRSNHVQLECISKELKSEILTGIPESTKSLQPQGHIGQYASKQLYLAPKEIFVSLICLTPDSRLIIHEMGSSNDVKTKDDMKHERHPERTQ